MSGHGRVGPIRLLMRLLSLAWLALVALVLAPFINRFDRPRARTIVRWWYGRMLHVFDINLRVHGKLPQTPVLMAANHTTWLDILVLGHVCGAAFIAKAEIARWPLIGAYARATKTVFLARGAFRTSEVERQICKTLASGRSVVLFPQGTTTAALPPAHFHARLFAPALVTQQPVMPLALRYFDADTPAGRHHPVVPWEDTPLLDSFADILRLPGLCVDIYPCAPIHPAGHTRRSLAEASRVAIAEAVACNERQASAL